MHEDQYPPKASRIRSEDNRILLLQLCIFSWHLRVETNRILTAGKKQPQSQPSRIKFFRQTVFFLVKLYERIYKTSKDKNTMSTFPFVCPRLRKWFWSVPLLPVLVTVQRIRADPHRQWSARALHLSLFRQWCTFLSMEVETAVCSRAAVHVLSLAGISAPNISML